MDLTPFGHTVSITVDRPPEDVWAIVADVSRIGELSPVCVSGAYDDPTVGAAAGSWFTGHNAIGDLTWDTRCRVDVAEPGREFTFINCGTGDLELARWGYTFEPSGTATVVTESWQVLPGYPEFLGASRPDTDIEARIAGMATMAADGMAATLARLKEVAEAG
jgi:carbon monoxide dehydrogenase subunit G